MPAAELRLVYAGHDLQDAATLQQKSIHKESTIHLLRLPPKAGSTGEQQRRPRPGAVPRSTTPHATTYDASDGWGVLQGIDVSAAQEWVQSRQGDITTDYGAFNGLTYLLDRSHGHH